MIEYGSDGRPLGLCLRCTECSGWTELPHPPGEATASSVAGVAGRPREARGRCLLSLCDPMPHFDGEDFLDAVGGSAAAEEGAALRAAASSAPSPAGRAIGAVGVGRGGAHGGARGGAVCGCCGCPEELHEDAGQRLGRFLEPGAQAAEGIKGVPREALRWSQLEVALWGDTGGLFWPSLEAGHAARAPVAEAEAEGGGEALISVICPTTAARRGFHQLLWMCFSCQCHERRELVIIDTCEEEPAEFFLEKMRRDRRVVYRHYRVPAEKWSVGLKRNLACYFASGQVIAHFDDDDIYSSCYLADMLRFMRSPHDALALHLQTGCSQEMLGMVLADVGHQDECRQGRRKHTQALDEASSQLILGKFGAVCAKLSSWHTLALQTGTWATFDALQNGSAGHGRQSQMYGWGFSMVYLRAAWEAVPFLHIDLGEDFDFVACLRHLCLPVILVPDTRGICAHTHHAGNTTGGCAERNGRKLKHIPTRLAAFAPMYVNAARDLC